MGLLIAKKQLSEEDLKEFLAKERSEGKKGRAAMGPQGAVERTETGDAPDAVSEAAHIKGLGFAVHRNAKLEEYKAQTLGSTSQLEGSSSCSLKKEEVKDEFGD